MKLESAKRKWATSGKIAMWVSVFWALETLGFLIAYGWHWEAYNIYEKRCDSLVLLGWGLAALYGGLAIKEAIDHILDTPE